MRRSGRTVLEDRQVALGLSLVALSIYLLSGVGRIDIIDGQVRYEVTRSLVDGAGFQLRDPALPQNNRIGVDGHAYSYYGPAASVLAAPLVLLARLLGGDRNSEMFAFSFSSALLVSACVGCFYLFRRALGASRPNALVWTAVLALATPLWPLATTVFDQGQHAALLLIGTYLCFCAAQKQRRGLAFVAGVVLGSVVLFQEGLLLLVPFLAIATLEGAAPRDLVLRAPGAWARVQKPLGRYLLVGAGALVPFVLFLTYNYVRFHTPFESGRGEILGHPPVWGDPGAGFLGLLFSPGKSIFLFCPTLIAGLCMLGVWLRRTPLLCIGIALASLVQLAIASSLTFWASDWAWGPRYLMLLAPLWMLPVGMSGWATGWKKGVALVLAPVGLCVQIMGIAVDQHPFFFSRNLSAYFWYDRPEVYWQTSQFFARPLEMWHAFTEPFPVVPLAFRPGPYMEIWPTYCVYGTYPPESHIWMQYFAVFHLPRPWPLWIGFLPDELKPVVPAAMLGLCLAVGCLGVFALGFGLRRRLARLGMAR